MIRFERVPEPPTFDEAARKPGLRWMHQHPHAKRPRDYWTPFKPDLADGFRMLCGYSAMWLFRVSCGYIQYVVVGRTLLPPLA